MNKRKLFFPLSCLGQDDAQLPWSWMKLQAGLHTKNSFSPSQLGNLSTYAKYPPRMWMRTPHVQRYIANLLCVDFIMGWKSDANVWDRHHLIQKCVFLFRPQEIAIGSGVSSKSIPLPIPLPLFISKPHISKPCFWSRNNSFVMSVMFMDFLDFRL